jgi:hypothetical protein
MGMRCGWIWPCIGSAVIMCSPADAKPSNLFGLTPEHFTATIKSRDDALERRAAFDTYNGWREQPSDVFLRAFVDKRTGEVEYQLYASVSTKGDWQFYDRINYQAPDQTVQEGKLIRVGSDVDCGAVRYGGRCRVYEDAIFVVSESLLRALAGLYAPGRAVAWQFKLKGKYIDGDYLNGISPAEAAGLLAVVDRYRASKGLTGPSVPTPQTQPVEATPNLLAAQAPPKPQPASPAKPVEIKKLPGVTCVTCN